ncbi:hypothetical protein OSTOST_12183, partial [Ostertagia ostertagi]
ATANGDDTSALGLFFRCPGKYAHDGSGYSYSCTVQQKCFKDVVPTASEAIGNIRFDSIFSLARLISIHEYEKSEQNKRFLMLDNKHPFITEWDEVGLKEPTKLLIILPDSFRAIHSVFREQRDVERQLYSRLSDISGLLENSTARTCLLIGPTTDTPFAKKDWCRLASSLGTAARMGMKIIAVAPPRGDKAYEQNRSDLNDAINLAKSSAVLSKQCLCSLIPSIESASEPSHGPGAHPRNSCAEPYSKDVLRVYVKSEVDMPPIRAIGESRVREYFKQRKEKMKLARPPKRYPKFSSFRTTQQMFPTQMLPNAVPVLQYPWMAASSSSYRGGRPPSRGRGAHRGAHRGHPRNG